MHVPNQDVADLLAPGAHQRVVDRLESIERPPRGPLRSRPTGVYHPPETEADFGLAAVARAEPAAEQVRVGGSRSTRCHAARR